MKFIKEPLKSKFQTANQMYKIVNSTSSDLQKININGKKAAKNSLVDYFDYIKNIKYRMDRKPREILARPAISLKFKNAGIDCKKKALLIAAWSKQNNIPFRFVASSRRPDRQVHHVFPQLYISGRYINVDATYPTNSINEKKRYTRMIVL
jgi:hypothetical protein